MHVFSLSIDTNISTEFNTPRYPRSLNRSPSISLALPFHIICRTVFSPSSDMPLLFLTLFQSLLSADATIHYSCYQPSPRATRYRTLIWFTPVPPIYPFPLLVYLVPCVSWPRDQTFLNCKILLALSLQRDTKFPYRTAAALFRTTCPPSFCLWHVSHAQFAHTNLSLYLIHFVSFSASVTPHPHILHSFPTPSPKPFLTDL